MSGSLLPPAWNLSILRAARWILAKKTPRGADVAHAGLLPAGFSAEHLGPNDFYYWDDFWAVAGLKAATRLMADIQGHTSVKDALAEVAEQFEADVFRSIEIIDARKRLGGIPASPYRRMDAGAIGSMVADYPLHLTPPNDPRIMNTLEYLLHIISFGAVFSRT